MLKSKEQPTPWCINIHQTNRKSLNVVCQKADINCSLGQERCDDGKIPARLDYCNLKRVLRKAKAITLEYSKKRHEMLTYGVVQLYDNSRPHTAARTGALLEHFNWELFDKSLCSPDLAPKNYRLFTYLKNLL
jgi:hypothetical protein